MTDDLVNQLTLNFLISKQQLQKLNKKTKEVSCKRKIIEIQEYSNRIRTLFADLLVCEPPEDLLFEVKSAFDNFIEKSIYYFKAHDNTENLEKDRNGEIHDDIDFEKDEREIEKGNYKELSNYEDENEHENEHENEYENEHENEDENENEHENEYENEHENEDENEHENEHEFTCKYCSITQGLNNCEKCDAENTCQNCEGEGGDYGPNEIWVCNKCLPECLVCNKKLHSAYDNCCGKGRSDKEYSHDIEPKNKDNNTKSHLPIIVTSKFNKIKNSEGVDDIQKLPLDWFENISKNYKKNKIIPRKKTTIVGSTFRDLKKKI